MSLFDRRKDTESYVERLREVAAMVAGVTIVTPHPFTPDEMDRLWCALFPAELECEKRWSPAKRARLDQLRAEFRETL